MDREYVARKLQEGWVVAGYSTTIMAAGAMTHSVLLQKGDRLDAFTVVAQGNKELGRNSITLA